MFFRNVKRKESDFSALEFKMQSLHSFDSTHQAPWLVWLNECVNELRVSTKTSTHYQALLRFKAFSSANVSTIICPTWLHTRSAVHNHFAESLLPSVCLTGTHTYTHIHIHAIKSLTKVLRSPSLYDCTSYIGGLFLHLIACLNILAWLCITQAEENNHQYSFCNRNLTMKWNQKWNTGFIPNVGCFTSHLAERES